MKLNKIISFLSATLLLAAVAACSDNDSLTALPSTTGQNENAAYNTLSFQWEKVAGAVQYSYQLVEDATGDIVVTDVTNLPSVTITGLKPSTDYTLTVLAYAAIGSDNTTSAPIVMHGRTDDLIALATPEVEMTREINTYVFEWDNLSGVDNYHWELLDADHNTVQSGDQRAPSLTLPFSDMPDGNYVFTLVAECSTPGMSNSATVEIPFTFVRQHEEIWRNSGNYTSALTGGKWKATIVAYDDNSYEIVSWYGTQGYNFSFTIDEQNASDMFQISADDYTYNSADQSYSVPTGLSSPATVKVFPTGNKCAMSGNSERGSVQLQVSDGTTTGTDKFSWGSVTVEDLVEGQWSMHTTCNFYYEMIDNTQIVTLTKVNDTTISIPTPEIWGNDSDFLRYRANMVLDLDAMTYTIRPVSGVVGYYTFASVDGSNVSLTGKFNSATFTISGWDMWYSGWSYIFDGGGTVVFTHLD